MTSSETLTHAVTVPQPMAWVLASGYCPVINSDTRPGLEHVGKLIGIHAGIQRFWPGSTRWQEVRRCLPDSLWRPEWEATTARKYPFPCGSLVGVARLAGVVRVRDGLYRVMRGNAVDVTLVDQALVRRIRPWWRGPWGWLLEDAVALSEPIPMRGAGGLWRLPEMRDGRRIGIDGDGLGEVAQRALEQWRKGRAER